MSSSIKGIVGMIVPPPDMRAIIDRTAEFIAKHGPEMEKKIYSSDPTKIRFAFIEESNPFHPYYKMAIQSYKEGKTPEIPKTEAAEVKKEEEKVEEKKAVAAASKSTVERKAKYDPLTSVFRSIPDEEPMPYSFSSTLPELYSLDLDVLRLTAQYTAVNGQKFLEGIMNYQSHNPQFDFLKPTHILNGFFTTLVEQYRKVLHFDKDIRDPLVQKYKNRDTSLSLSAHRLEYHHQEMARKRQQEAANNDSISMQTIDWGDFAVVETITFDDDNKALPAAEKLIESEQMEVDMETEESQPPTSTLTSDGLKVVDNYEPRLKSGVEVPRTMIDPLTHRVVPLDQANEHLRIELIDPMWKKQKEVRKERDATSNLVDGTQISDTIHRMRAKKEEELQMKRGAPEMTEAEASSIDDELKRQKMQAMGVKDMPAAPVAPAVVSNPVAPSVPAPPASQTSAPGTAPIPMPPPMSMPMPVGLHPMPAMPAMPAMPTVPLPVPMPAAAMPTVPSNIVGSHSSLDVLIPAPQWIATHPGPVSLIIRLPVDNTNPSWSLRGQSITILIDIGATVKTLKQQISEIQGGMPASKQQLKHAIHGFLKDAQTLGYYNLVSGMELQLTVRSRGGRK